MRTASPSGRWNYSTGTATASARCVLPRIDGTVASVDGRLARFRSPAPCDDASARLPRRPQTPRRGRAAGARRPLLPSSVVPATTTRPPSSPSSMVPPRRSWKMEEDSGFFTRAGRTIDHTNHTVVNAASMQTNETVKRSLRKTGATIQRFFRRSQRSGPENTTRITQN